MVSQQMYQQQFKDKEVELKGLTRAYNQLVVERVDLSPGQLIGMGSKV